MFSREGYIFCVIQNVFTTSFVDETIMLSASIGGYGERLTLDAYAWAHSFKNTIVYWLSFLRSPYGFIRHPDIRAPILGIKGYLRGKYND